jgi:CspA family cold shock protein
MTGVVRWFDGSKGYGYIDAEDGENIFVHYSAIDGGFSSSTLLLVVLKLPILPV